MKHDVAQWIPTPVLDPKTASVSGSNKANLSAVSFTLHLMCWHCIFIFLHLYIELKNLLWP